MAEEELYELPSYHDAKQLDPWPHILPFPQRRDLLSLCRVNRRLRGRVQGYIWRNPRRFFPHDEVDALNAFLGYIEAARLLSGKEPASYTRTVDISTLGNDNFYIDISNDWLAIAMSQLPTLRSLKLASSPLLDSKAMSYVQNVRYEHIRFLDISYCGNVTSERLSSMIALLPQLHFLDLSGHWRLRAAGVLHRIRKLACLKILRLKECNLVDSDVSELFSQSNDPSLRSVSSLQSLNLNFNKLTDECIHPLSTLFREPTLSEDNMPPSYSETLDPASRPSKLEDPTYYMFEGKLKSMEAEERRQFQFRDDPEEVMTYLENPNLPDAIAYTSELTHLYISGNEITFSGLLKLLASNQIEALDCGSVGLGEGGSLNCPEKDNIVNMRLFHQVITRSNRLKYLRISHHMLTGFQADSSQTDRVSQNMSTSTPADDSPFPLGLYCIDKLVLTQIPVRRCIYSQLQQFHASYDEMQKKFFSYQHRQRLDLSKLPVHDYFIAHSPLTKELILETIGEEGKFDNEDNILDIPLPKTMNDDFTFFPNEKTNKEGMETQEQDNSKQNETSMKENPSNEQSNLADLIKNVHQRMKATGNSLEQSSSSLDNIRWHGKVTLVNAGLNQRKSRRGPLNFEILALD